eukprot:4032665-Prymnesium_polylepis.1
MLRSSERDHIVTGLQRDARHADIGHDTRNGTLQHPGHTSALQHRFPPAPQSCPPHAGSPHTAQSRNVHAPFSRTAA